MQTVTEIIESYAVRPVMQNATLEQIGLDSLDVLMLARDIEDAEGLYIEDGQWTINTTVETVLSDVAKMRAQG